MKQARFGGKQAGSAATTASADRRILPLVKSDKRATGGKATGTAW